MKKTNREIKINKIQESFKKTGLAELSKKEMELIFWALAGDTKNSNFKQIAETFKDTYQSYSTNQNKEFFELETKRNQINSLMDKICLLMHMPDIYFFKTNKSKQKEVK